jgi:hypothetical protein
MTDQEWESICFLVEEWWPPSPAEGEFDEHRRRSWRLALDGFEADAIAQAIKALLIAGGKWRPRVAEVIGQLRKDPSKPTFEEAYQLIYGSRGVLRAQPIVSIFPSESDRARAYAQAAKDRVAGMHPLVAAFVSRYGVDRLRNLEVDHLDYGDLKRRELREAWERHCEALDGRNIAALAAGRRGEIGRLDPLAALGGGPAPEPAQIAGGSEA